MPSIDKSRTADSNWDEYYSRLESGIEQQVDQSVCGCDFYGSSWMNATEAMELAALMKLSTSTRLLDIGSGAGWPALYQSQKTGCSVTLTDLSRPGLKAACMKAIEKGLDDRCQTVHAGAESLPFADDSFEAIGHADVLCCLEEKMDALRECRRVITDGGIMSFSIIHLRPGVTAREIQIATAAGPAEIAAPAPYPEMLRETGWNIDSTKDITEGYRSILSNFQLEYEKNRENLSEQLGEDDYKESLEKFRAKQKVVTTGIVQRSLITATPH